MHRKTRWIIFIIMILVLTSLACRTLLGDKEEPGSDRLDVEPVEEATVVVSDASASPAAPTEEPAPEDTAVPSTAASDAAGTIDLGNSALYSALGDFASVFINLTLTYEETTDAGVSTGRIVVDGIRVVEPPAVNMTFTVEGDGTELDIGGFSLIEVEGTGYFVLPDGSCISGNAEDMAGSMDDLLEIEGLLGDEAQLLESSVTVNGVLADRYTIDSKNLESGATLGGADFEVEEAFVSIARDGGFIVQVAITGTGQGSFLDIQQAAETRISYELNLTPSDEAVTIDVPEGCLGDGGGETDFPIAADAYDVSTFAGLTTYSSNQSVEELVAFYQTEMAAAGWTIGQEYSDSDLASLQFTMDDRTVAVTITSDNATGVRTVVIFEE